MTTASSALRAIGASSCWARRCRSILATAVDAAVAGRKRLQLGQTRLGPIRIQEVDVELDGSTVKRGFVSARVDDGRFKGSTANLIVDGASGLVSGSLDVDIQVPGALAKKVTLHLGEGPLQLSVQLANGDFLSRELPVTASAMGLVVKQSAGGLDVSLDGSARVGLDKGFADASGTLTARLGVGSGGVALDATIHANLKVPGLGETAATLKWDGKQTTLSLKSAVRDPRSLGHGAAHLPGRKAFRGDSRPQARRGGAPAAQAWPGLDRERQAQGAGRGCRRHDARRARRQGGAQRRHQARSRR